MKILKIILYFICGFVLLSGILFIFVTAGMRDIRKMNISQVDLSRIDNGIYEGKYHKNRWTYDLQVVVKEHRIVEIRNTNKKMEMLKEFNQKAAEAIIKTQKTDIDAVSGASINTKAFSKAVENALISGNKIQN